MGNDGVKAGRKPGSVHRSDLTRGCARNGGDHLSGIAVAGDLERRESDGTGKWSTVVPGPKPWPCSRPGFTEPASLDAAGALLPHLCTLACTPGSPGPSAVCFCGTVLTVTRTGRYPAGLTIGEPGLSSIQSRQTDVAWLWTAITSPAFKFTLPGRAAEGIHDSDPSSSIQPVLITPSLSRVFLYLRRNCGVDGMVSSIVSSRSGN